MIRLVLCFYFAAILLTQAAGTAEHVVIIVWDGLRPDFVTAENTPTLFALSKEGTFFSHHHPVYLSSTEVNGTALATGMYPEHSGIIGNREFRPQIDIGETVATEKTSTVRRGDAVTGGKYLAVPTIYEILQAHGYPTMIAGTKPVALLADRSEKREMEGAKASNIVYAGHAIPQEMLPEIEKNLGAFPNKITFPDVGQNTWTTQVLIEELWKKNVPKLSLLWLSDPDYSQHHSQPGSEEAIASLKANDQLLAQLLAKLDSAGVRAKTDVFLVSDHGFSTIEKNADLESTLSHADFHVARKFTSKPNRGDILLLGNGGSVFFYITDHDKETTRRLVELLQHGSYSGVIFASGSLPGTFDLETARIHSPDAPDVVLSLQWNNKRNTSGVAGSLVSEGNPLTSRSPGQGMHGSLSAYDMHNTLIAAGPDFRKGFIDDLPSGNTDVAPTALWILGIPQAQKMDGRVLSEALITNTEPKPQLQEKTLKAVNESKDNRWNQYLKTVTVGNTLYMDEGNGTQITK